MASPNILRAVILTALPTEYAAVRRHLSDLKETTHPKGTVYETSSNSNKEHNFWTGIFNGASGLRWQVSIVENRRRKSEGCRRSRASDCYLLPTKSTGTRAGKVATKFRTRPEVFTSSYLLVQRARVEARNDSWLQRVGSSPGRKPTVFVAPIAAGEKVVASTKTNLFRFIRESYSDALAVEMEGRGFLEAAHANQDVLALLVRGISDLIDNKSEDDLRESQVYASINASAFVFEVLGKYSLTGSSDLTHTQNGTSVTDDTLPKSRRFDFFQNKTVEEIIERVRVGDYNSASLAAARLARMCSYNSHEGILESLIGYCNSQSDDLKWAALDTISEFSRIATRTV